MLHPSVERVLVWLVRCYYYWPSTFLYKRSSDRTFIRVMTKVLKTIFLLSNYSVITKPSKRSFCYTSLKRPSVTFFLFLFTVECFLYRHIYVINVPSRTIKTWVRGTRGTISRGDPSVSLLGLFPLNKDDSASVWETLSGCLETRVEGELVYIDSWFQTRLLTRKYIKLNET